MGQEHGYKNHHFFLAELKYEPKLNKLTIPILQEMSSVGVALVEFYKKLFLLFLTTDESLRSPCDDAYVL